MFDKFKYSIDTLRDKFNLLKNEQRSISQLAAHSTTINATPLALTAINSPLVPNSIPPDTLSEPLTHPIPNPAQLVSQVGHADIAFRFPDTTNYADMNISEVASAPEYNWDNPYNETNSLLESNASAIVNTAEPGDSDLNVLFFNCSGWRLSRLHIERAIAHYDIHLAALNEHWWRWDLNLRGFPYEACSRARMPYHQQLHE